MAKISDAKRQEFQSRMERELAENGNDPIEREFIADALDAEGKSLTQYEVESDVNWGGKIPDTIEFISTIIPNDSGEMTHTGPAIVVTTTGMMTLGLHVTRVHTTTFFSTQRAREIVADLQAAIADAENAAH